MPHDHGAPCVTATNGASQGTHTAPAAHPQARDLDVHILGLMQGGAGGHLRLGLIQRGLDAHVRRPAAVKVLAQRVRRQHAAHLVVVHRRLLRQPARAAKQGVGFGGSS